MRKVAVRSRDGSMASIARRRSRSLRPWDRMGRGILSNAKGVGAGVMEYRIDSGPGYRVYFGRDGDTLIVLLGGGTKRRQQGDIENAKRLWRDYRRRRREELRRWH